VSAFPVLPIRKEAHVGPELVSDHELSSESSSARSAALVSQGNSLTPPVPCAINHAEATQRGVWFELHMQLDLRMGCL
jgi:hypothetical protein